MECKGVLAHPGMSLRHVPAKTRDTCACFADQWHRLPPGVPHLVVYTAFFYFSSMFFCEPPTPYSVESELDKDNICCLKFDSASCTYEVIF